MLNDEDIVACLWIVAYMLGWVDVCLYAVKYL